MTQQEEAISPDEYSHEERRGQRTVGELFGTYRSVLIPAVLRIKTMELKRRFAFCKDTHTRDTMARFFGKADASSVYIPTEGIELPSAM